MNGGLVVIRADQNASFTYFKTAVRGRVCGIAQFSGKVFFLTSLVALPKVGIGAVKRTLRGRTSSPCRAGVGPWGARLPLPRAVDLTPGRTPSGTRSPAQISGRHVHVVRIEPRTHRSRGSAQSAGTEFAGGWPVAIAAGRFTAPPWDADP